MSLVPATNLDATQQPPAGELEPATGKQAKQLVDRFGRVHRSLRISLTDVCNIRCQYCMPEEGAQFVAKSKLLSFPQIEAFVRDLVPWGIRNIRLTGGEPLLRPNLHRLVARLAKISGVDDLALTTNGTILAQQLPELVAAGLRRINISLDTVSEETFQRISRRNGLDKVLESIDRALQYPELTVKLNALVLRDVNLSGLTDLVEFSLDRGMDLRFIEFMPLDAQREWSEKRMVSGQELRALLVEKYGPLERLPVVDPARPSNDYRFADGRAGRLGFIDSVSSPFCRACDRLRLTADGKVRNCLFSAEEWDIAEYLDLPDRSDYLSARLRECLQAKHASHGIDQSDFKPPERAMYQIGG